MMTKSALHQNSSLSQASGALSTSQRSDFPTVSILINNYNYERFLRQCIESCLNQIHSPLEIIIVDDGSVDGSRNIIQDYSQSYEQVTAVFQANQGQASAINAGVAQSSGDLIMLLDADDYFYPHAVQHVVEAWQPGYAMLHSRLDIVDCSGNYIDQHPMPELSFDNGNVIPLLLEMGRYSTNVTSGLSFSRTALEEVLPIPEENFRLCADGYLVTVIPFHGLVTSVEDSVGGRRKHGANLWASGDACVAQRRRHLDHDYQRYHYLSKMAERCGYSLDESTVSRLGLRDPEHLISRLVSLRLEPETHLFTNDRRWNLTWHGVIAIWANSNLNIKRRVVLMFWFLSVGLLPSALAQASIRWRLSQQSRPQVINRVLRMLRMATQ